MGSLGSVTADTGRPQPALGSGVCTRIQPETGGAQESLVPGGSSVGVWGWQGSHPEGVWVTLWSLGFLLLLTGGPLSSPLSPRAASVLGWAPPVEVSAAV